MLRINKNALFKFFFCFHNTKWSFGSFNSPEVTLKLNWKHNWILTGNLIMHLTALRGMNRIAFENVLLFWRLMWFSDFDRKWKHTGRLSKASESARFFLEAKDSLAQVGYSPTHALPKQSVCRGFFAVVFFPPDGVTRGRLLVACQGLYNIVAKCNPKLQFWR